MGPVIKEMQARSIPFYYIHTGQHYDYFLSQVFIEDLNLPRPNFRFFVRVDHPAKQTAKIMINIEKYLLSKKPLATLVQGDTNTILASAIASMKNHIPVGHIEAGLRSYDLRMQEEHNRRMVDHISKYLFAPTQYNKETLQKENVWGEIFVTGNTVIDACIQNMKIAEERSIVMDSLRFDDYTLVTLHRAENIDTPELLKIFVDAFIQSEVPIFIPLHPRTKRRLMEFGLLEKLRSARNIQLHSPVDYYDMLVLMKNSKIIATDSGGLQEEATAPPIRKYVLILRKSTERVEAIKSGFAELVELTEKGITEAISKNFAESHNLPKISPYGDGTAGKKIVSILEDKFEW